MARPYAVQTSGSTNVKYTGNYDGAGSISMTYPAATNPFTITKTISSAADFVGAPGPLTYTVTVGNPSSQPSVISKIVDVLPAGMCPGQRATYGIRCPPSHAPNLNPIQEPFKETSSAPGGSSETMSTPSPRR